MSSSPVAKLCMSCAHFTQDICYRFQKYSFVTGLAEYVSAELSRGSKKMCGKHGKYFTRASVKQKYNRIIR